MSKKLLTVADEPLPTANEAPDTGDWLYAWVVTEPPPVTSAVTVALEVAPGPAGTLIALVTVPDGALWAELATVLVSTKRSDVEALAAPEPAESPATTVKTTVLPTWEPVKVMTRDVPVVVPKGVPSADWTE
jgi:hypothetical protein